MSKMIDLALRFHNKEVTAPYIELEYLKLWRTEKPAPKEEIAIAEWDIWGACERYSPNVPDDNTSPYALNEKQMRSEIEAVLKRISVI